MGCSCRNKDRNPRYGVVVPTSFRVATAMIPGSLGAAESPRGLVYAFGDEAHAQSFMKYLKSTYNVASTVQRLR